MTRPMPQLRVLTAVLFISISGALDLSAQPVDVSLSDEFGYQGDTITMTTTMVHPDMDGWSFGACHDASTLDLQTIDDGLALVLDPPAFNQQTLYDGGFTIAVVFFGPGFFFPAATSEINVATYTVISDQPDLTTPIEFCEALGSPVVGIQFIPDGLGVSTPDLTLTDGTVLVNPTSFFRRGDADFDGSVSIADGIAILNALFLGADFLCESAADVDDSGSLDLADPIRLLNSLFASGAPLPAPSTSCGEDPTPDPLTCPPLNCL